MTRGAGRSTGRDGDGADRLGDAGRLAGADGRPQSGRVDGRLSTGEFARGKGSYVREGREGTGRLSGRPDQRGLDSRERGARSNRSKRSIRSTWRSVRTGGWVRVGTEGRTITPPSIRVASRAGMRESSLGRESGDAGRVSESPRRIRIGSELPKRRAASPRSTRAVREGARRGSGPSSRALRSGEKRSLPRLPACPPGGTWRVPVIWTTRPWVKRRLSSPPIPPGRAALRNCAIERGGGEEEGERDSPGASGHHPIQPRPSR